MLPANIKAKQPQATEAVATRVDAATKDALLELCKREGFTVSALLQALVKDVLRSYNGKGK